VLHVPMIIIAITHSGPAELNSHLVLKIQHAMVVKRDNQFAHSVLSMIFMLKVAQERAQTADLVSSVEQV